MRYQGLRRRSGDSSRGWKACGHSKRTSQWRACLSLVRAARRQLVRRLRDCFLLQLGRQGDDYLSGMRQHAQPRTGGRWRRGFQRAAERRLSWAGRGVKSFACDHDDAEASGQGCEAKQLSFAPSQSSKQAEKTGRVSVEVARRLSAFECCLHPSGGDEKRVGAGGPNNFKTGLECELFEVSKAESTRSVGLAVVAPAKGTPARFKQAQQSAWTNHSRQLPERL